MPAPGERAEDNSDEESTAVEDNDVRGKILYAVRGVGDVPPPTALGHAT